MSRRRSRRQRIAEQVDLAGLTQEDLTWGRNVLGGEEDYYWRRLSDDFALKDIVPATYLELHNQCYEAWNANPLASAIIEMTTSFVLGKGISIEANHKKVQRLLQQFWHDPANRMDERIYDLCQELALYGEIFVRFFVNPYDGSVRLRLIDPSLIDLIETDPEDVETPLRFHRRPLGQNVSQLVSPEQLRMRVEAVDSEGEWFQAGTEMVQFAINKVSNAKRGRSDLATLLPWLRRYKDWLTDRVRINKYKGAFLWDVQLSGADKKTIDRKRMEYSYPPEPGSVLLHNESEKWTAVQPAINANDAREDGRALKLMIAVGAGLPEHYLSDASQGNRATAAEMGLPALLRFQRRQKILKYIVRTILDRVLLEARRAGKLGTSIDTSYDVLFPEIDCADHQTLASACRAWSMPSR
ncbi:hypothetical protein [Dictyobacter kobayashii]|uniref:Phage portal protein n=1 Tax=Dictyobacter kobayashii TaxID=2014872 RepID=A0A402ARA1_9CHLR|nr:hypothetical protein [Dictyobacter kobayashii]GCE21603.1 hypothetical protein KDK_54030 [Dictyobacter kobayashii]